jgi:hypothetical protein
LKRRLGSDRDGILFLLSVASGVAGGTLTALWDPPDYLVDDVLKLVQDLMEKCGEIERAVKRLKKGKP